MLLFVGLHYSPWSEKARWALDHHRIAYRYQKYEPMIGEPGLRLRLGRFSGKVTVPALVGDGFAAMGSFEIATYAERNGSGAPLLPKGRSAEVRAWDDRSELAMQAGRMLVVQRLAASPPAQEEALPSFIPSALRPAARGLAGMGIAYFKRKYGLAGDPSARTATVEAALVALREGLAGRPHLLGDFSYADVTMAVVLQGVVPVGDEHLALGPATRACWTVPDLAARFPDLLAWRDELYAKHRLP